MFEREYRVLVYEIGNEKFLCGGGCSFFFDNIGGFLL